MIPNTRGLFVILLSTAQKDGKDLILRLGGYANGDAVLKVLDVGEDYVRGINGDGQEEFFAISLIPRWRDVSESDAHKAKFIGV